MIELLKQYAGIIAPFLALYTVAVAAIAYRLGKSSEHYLTAGRIIDAKHEAFERGRQSVMLFDDLEFQAVDEGETPPDQYAVANAILRAKTNPTDARQS